MLLTGRCSFLCCHWQVKKTGGGSGHVPADGDRRSFVSLLSCHLVPFLVLLSVLAGVAPHHRRQRLSALYTSHWQQPIRLPPFACPSRRHLRTRPFPQPPPLACLWHLRITISIVLRFHYHRRQHSPVQPCQPPLPVRVAPILATASPPCLLSLSASAA